MIYPYQETIFGVPQGTVTGPNLFVLYINIMKYIKKCSIQIFADDNLIYLAGDDVDSTLNNK